MTAKKPLLLSIVICTFNRADSLRVALQSISELDAVSAIVEIIVVDNNSTDNTRQVVENFKCLISNLCYCCEINQGLSHARNRGISESRGEYVYYIDDDVKLPTHWLGTALDIIRDVTPDAFGGPHYAFYNSSRPKWLKDSYGSHSHADEAGYLNNGKIMPGMNFGFKKKLLEELGGFRTEFGMTGKRIAYGEETDLQARFWKASPDARVYYDPKLFVYHLVHESRMHLYWQLRQEFLYGQYNFRIHGLDGSDNLSRLKIIIRMLKTGRYMCRDMVLGFLRRNHAKYPMIQNYLIEYVSRHLNMLGRYYECFKAKAKK